MVFHSPKPRIKEVRDKSDSMNDAGPFISVVFLFEQVLALERSEVGGTLILLHYI